jgi:dihydroorotase
VLIAAARVFCAAAGLDGPGWVAVRGDRIAAVGAGPPPAAPDRSFPRGVLLPGLVDFHAHPGLPESRFGVCPDTHLLPYGVTGVLAQGEAGADNLEAYLEGVVRRARVQVRLALNLAPQGEEGAGGCFAGRPLPDPERCAAAARAGGAAVWGVAVNTSPASCGETDPRAILRLAIQAAESASLPLLVGTRRHPDVPLAEQLALLRPGDVVTYCFHGGAEGLLTRGRVRRCVRQARDRGIRFDLGHGWASFSFAVAEACLAQGFPPDTLSTDFYRRHVGARPRHDLPLVLSKLIAAGMPEREAFTRVTRAPAEALGLPRALREGAVADLVALESAPGGLVDCHGQTRPGSVWEARWVLRGGVPVEPPGPAGAE